MEYKIIVRNYFNHLVELFQFGNIVTGKTGWAAPRLKDAALSSDKLREGYVEVSLTVRCYGGCHRF